MNKSKMWEALNSSNLIAPRGTGGTMNREEVKKFMETVKDDYIRMPNTVQVVLDTAKKATVPHGTERIGI